MSDDAIQMLFEDCHGRPVPRLPRAKSGALRISDGLRYFTLELASAFFSIPENDLRLLWVDFMDDFTARGEDQPAADKVTPTSAEAELDARRRDVLHRGTYPQLSREQFDAFMAAADGRRLNPLAGEIGCDLRHDERTAGPRLFVYLTAKGMRILAHRTGKFIGADDIQFDYGDDPYRPAKATATVWKLVKGKRRRFRRSVYWGECAPAPGKDNYWDTRPHEALGSRAEAAALKLAFPKLGGNLHLPDDLPRDAMPSNPTRRKRPASPLDPPIKLGAPTTRIEAESEMIGLGLTDPVSRERAIEALIRKFAEMYERNEQSFWGVAVGYLKRNPHEFRDIG